MSTNSRYTGCSKYVESLSGARRCQVQARPGQSIAKQSGVEGENNHSERVGEKTTFLNRLSGAADWLVPLAHQQSQDDLAQSTLIGQRYLQKPKPDRCRTN